MDVLGRAGAVSVVVRDNYGTLVVGDHNVINLAGVSAPVLEPHTPADVHRPVEPDGFLNRRVETARALAALRAGAAVEVHGPTRIGKSFLLRHVASAGEGAAGNRR